MIIKDYLLKVPGTTEHIIIKNIIFDLGNVLIDINLDRTIEEFRKLGVKKFEDLYTFEKQTRTFTDYETGMITTAAFREHLRPHLKKDVTDQEIDHAWKAMLSDLPAERVRLLESLKPNYRLFLLSNTNEMHVQQFTADADAVHGKNIFEKLFEKTYYSNEIKMRKPDTGIFEFVIKDAGLNPSETLFIDDSDKNIEGARKAGLHGHWLEDKNVFSAFE